MKRLLAHASVILSGMILVLLLIDRVNSSMQFIDNRITKGLLFALCAVALLNGATAIFEASRTRAQRAAKKRARLVDSEARRAYNTDENR